MTLTLNKHQLPVDEYFSKDDYITQFSKDLDTCRGINVVDELSFKLATSKYAEAREWKKKIEERRKQIIEPQRKWIAAINDQAKEVTEYLDQIIDMMNSKTGKYTLELEQKKAEADALLREEAKELFGVDELYIPAAPKLHGNGASVMTKVEKRFRVVDLSKVPLEYLMLDEAKVKLHVKSGVSTIPGVEIYEEKVTHLRTK